MNEDTELRVIPSRTAHRARLGQLFAHRGTNAVAAVCQVPSRPTNDYRLVWLTRAMGPNPFFAALNAEKWERVEGDFYRRGDPEDELVGSTDDGPNGAPC